MKKILLSGIIFCFGMLMIGCGSSTDSETTTTKDNADEQKITTADIQVPDDVKKVASELGEDKIPTEDLKVTQDNYYIDGEKTNVNLVKLLNSESTSSINAILNSDNKAAKEYKFNGSNSGTLMLLLAAVNSKLDTQVSKEIVNANDTNESVEKELSSDTSDVLFKYDPTSDDHSMHATITLK
ncbi:TPA_asm: hypothetical protein GEK33_02540 [Listeria monocytogenes]|nr:hypothetical protein [Listeria monocytogenes]HAA2887807.1 hypothetical protein [Listeria monocytogenes]